VIPVRILGVSILAAITEVYPVMAASSWYRYRLHHIYDLVRCAFRCAFHFDSVNNDVFVEVLSCNSISVCLTITQDVIHNIVVSQ
jgi:hypothetical protein